MDRGWEEGECHLCGEVHLRKPDSNRHKAIIEYMRQRGAIEAATRGREMKCPLLTLMGICGKLQRLTSLRASIKLWMHG